MSFFDGPIAGPTWEAAIPGSPDDPSVGRFPTAVPIPPLLFLATASFAVALVGIFASRSGFEFWIRARFNGDQPLDSPAYAAQDSVRVGLQFPNGQKVAIGSTEPPPHDKRTPPIIFAPLRGGGGRAYRDWSYWVSPLPSPGVVHIAFSWLAVPHSEGIVQIDAERIIAAADTSIDLWL